MVTVIVYKSSVSDARSFHFFSFLCCLAVELNVTSEEINVNCPFPWIFILWWCAADGIFSSETVVRAFTMSSHPSFEILFQQPFGSLNSWVSRMKHKSFYCLPLCKVLLLRMSDGLIAFRVCDSRRMSVYNIPSGGIRICQTTISTKWILLLFPVFLWFQFPIKIHFVILKFDVWLESREIHMCFGLVRLVLIDYLSFLSVGRLSIPDSRNFYICCELKEHLYKIYKRNLRWSELLAERININTFGTILETQRKRKRWATMVLLYRFDISKKCI